VMSQEFGSGPMSAEALSVSERASVAPRGVLWCRAPWRPCPLWDSLIFWRIYFRDENGTV